MTRWSFAGLLGATCAAALSVAPSLVPRAGVIQGLLMGVLAAIGYGLGALVGWGLRSIRQHPDWHPGARLRIATWFSCGAILICALLAGFRWQSDLAGITAVPGPKASWVPIAAGTAALVFVVVLIVSRGSRWATRRLAQGLQRVTAPRVATASALTFSVLLGAVAIDRVPTATVDLLNPLFRRANAATPAGVSPPTSTVVSGGPGSTIAWADLGSQGRAFAAGVTPVVDLRAFTGRPAKPPIRVFVGLDSAQTDAERAQLAVRELERFGAFDRKVIAIGTSAGSGTVDPGEVTPLEYLLNGDVATVSTQYSILPSFLSFLVDRPNSVQASRTLLDAVRARAEQRPRRPRIVVFGESLGAYGASSTFADLAQLLADTDGALFQGPPNSSPLWRHYTAQREPGSPEHLPVYDNGRHLRWANGPSDLGSPVAEFLAPRTVFLQNASDPVVWWSPRVAWSRPDWLTEPRGPGVLVWPWIPLVSFAGLTGDMMNSQGVPAGYGHVYGVDPVAAWATILRPPGWTPADTVRLEQHLGG